MAARSPSLLGRQRAYQLERSAYDGQMRTLCPICRIELERHNSNHTKMPPARRRHHLVRRVICQLGHNLRRLARGLEQEPAAELADLIERVAVEPPPALASVTFGGCSPNRHRSHVGVDPRLRWPRSLRADSSNRCRTRRTRRAAGLLRPEQAVSGSGATDRAATRGRSLAPLLADVNPRRRSHRPRSQVARHRPHGGSGRPSRCRRSAPGDARHEGAAAARRPRA